MTEPIVDILMYHSIANDDVATAIPPDIFRAQMHAIKEAGVPVITLDDYAAARCGEKELDPVSLIITFDDAFQDFYDEAFPTLDELGFDAMVYVPTGCVGTEESWRGALTPPRKIMDWQTILELSEAGVHFGSHSISHPDLNSLKMLDLVEELRRSKFTLEEHLGKPVDHFAPPYGLADYFARSTVERLYKTSVGTNFQRADLSCDIMDLPRLEMFYFKKLSHWERHLAGEGATYLARRRAMRHAREVVNRPWERV